MYGDLHELSRAKAGCVEPFFARLSTRDLEFWCANGLQETVTEQHQLGMFGADMAPRGERQQDTAVLRIDRLPHPGIVREGGKSGNSFFQTCLDGWRAG